MPKPRVSSGRAWPQNEVSLALDPLHPDVLLAASASYPVCGVRVYGSPDGGRSWSSRLLRVAGTRRRIECNVDHAQPPDARQIYRRLRVARIIVALDRGPAQG